MMKGNETTKAALITQVGFGLGLLVLIVLGRTLPHMMNFAPVAAAGLFAGYLFAQRRWGIAIVLGGMIASDLVIGMDDLGMRLLVYVAMIVPVFLGGLLRSDSLQGRPGAFAFSVLGLGVGSSLLFFVLSNFGVWLGSGMYSYDLSGLTLCFVKAIPFYRATLLGDAVYITVFFGVYHLVAGRSAAAAAQVG